MEILRQTLRIQSLSLVEQDLPVAFIGLATKHTFILSAEQALLASRENGNDIIKINNNNKHLYVTGNFTESMGGSIRVGFDIMR